MSKPFPRLNGDARIYSCIGIGFGPSNMALAIALEKCGTLEDTLFLEARENFDWHPGMLIPGADIQHNPLRDLVTPHDPTSSYGFLSYLKANDRLLHYLNLDSPYPPRFEYANYIKWVGRQFLHVVRLGTTADEMDYAVDADDRTVIRVSCSDGDEYFARTISFGTGRSPYIPDIFRPHLCADVVHLTDYLYAKSRWSSLYDNPHIAVLGGSQSAIEIILDLASCAKVVGISKSFPFKHKDLSPFTEQIYFPDFVDYFYNAAVEDQRRITSELRRSNYGAADRDVISQLSLRLYEQRLRNEDTIRILRNTVVEDILRNDVGRSYCLHLREKYSGARATCNVDGIVLATGFRNFGSGEYEEPFHPLLSNVAEFANFRTDGGVEIDRSFRLSTDKCRTLPPVFINGLSESSHGFGDAGSFSLLSVRSNHIAEALRQCISRSTGSPTICKRSTDRSRPVDRRDIGDDSHAPRLNADTRTRFHAD